MRLYNINANLIQFIGNLSNKAISAVYLSGGIGDWFRTTVGVRQGCLLSPNLFNTSQERIMTDALEEKEQSASEAKQLATFVFLMTLMAWQEKRRH